MTRRLKHIAVLNTGGVWGEDPDGLNDMVVLRSTDQTVDGGWRITDPAIRSVSANEARKVMLKEGDILVTKSSGSDLHIGKASLVDATVAALSAGYSNFNQRLRLNQNQNPRFWWYFMNSTIARYHYVVEANSTSGLGNLTAGIMGNVPIPDFDLATQKAIADFLDRETARIDQLIEKKQRLIGLLEERWIGRVERAVIPGIEPDTIPEHWRVTTLRRLTTDIQTGPFGSQLHSHEYVEDGIPVINPSHMVRRRINADPKIAVDKATWQRLERHAVREGDILVARRGELGRCALVTEQEDGWLCGTGSLRLRIRKDLAVPEFLVYALSTRRVSEWLSLQSVGSTMDNLNTGILGRLRLPIPQVPEQLQIVAHLNSVEQSTELLTNRVYDSIDRLKESRSSLITAAVTGQLDISAWSKRGETEYQLETIEAVV